MSTTCSGAGCPRAPGVRMLWRRRHLRRTLHALDPDIVQTQNLWPSGEWAYRAGQRPVVQGVWGSDVLVVPKTDPQKRALAQTLLREADAITVNSDGLKQGVTDLGVPAELVHRIGWGVDTRVRYTGERDRSLIDTIFPGRPVVASPRLHKQLYNLDVIMAAIPLVQREVPEAAFLFMAYGVETDALRRQAEQLGVTDSVHFRRFTEDEVPLVFAGSELTVSVPASDTGRPTSLLEAMAARLPVVLGDLPAIHELIEQGDGAEIVPLRDVEATAAAIVRLLSDDQLRRRYGDRNREVVVREADATVETDRCIELYRRLTSLVTLYDHGHDHRPTSDDHRPGLRPARDRVRRHARRAAGDLGVDGPRRLGQPGVERSTDHRAGVVVHDVVQGSGRAGLLRVPKPCRPLLRRDGVRDLRPGQGRPPVGHPQPRGQALHGHERADDLSAAERQRRADLVLPGAVDQVAVHIAARASHRDQRGGGGVHVRRPQLPHRRARSGDGRHHRDDPAPVQARPALSRHPAVGVSDAGGDGHRPAAPLFLALLRQEPSRLRARQPV